MFIFATKRSNWSVAKQLNTLRAFKQRTGNARFLFTCGFLFFIQLYYVKI